FKNNLNDHIFDYETKPRVSARSYPRHACSLYVVVFMHLHDMSKSPPVLAGVCKNDPQSIMRFHAA
ncbi:hypothetical protein, partial [Escherichia coli]|uniref:hypothetical protein n=1 Tax=Escherichia coli TaxID=562 RepID=UPI003A96A442